MKLSQKYKVDGMFRLEDSTDSRFNVEPIHFNYEKLFK